jgi:signal peptidase I
MNFEPDKPLQPASHADKEPFGQSSLSPVSSVTPPGNLPPATSYPPTAAPQGRHSNHQWSEILSTVLLLILAPVVALLIILFAIQSYQVDGQSMDPTLKNRDRLIVSKLPRTVSRITGHAYVPHRGDIIIFNEANLPDTLPGQQKQLIKRIIGLPGDRVVVKDSKITVFNKDNPAGFNPDTTVGYHFPAVPTPGPGNREWDIKSEQLFVCGDNRPNSEDSRYFGPIHANQIVGKLVLRLLPLNKAQRF